MMEAIRIGIVGNPNCGKTTVFNALTGASQQVGNWPGVTVDRTTGNYVHESRRIDVVDLPGIYSLSSASLDEKIARDYIVKEHPDLMVNVVDATNLERNLYLTIQLLEMRVPCVVVLNMMDSAERKKIRIDVDALARILGCPVVATTANKAQGIGTVKEVIHESFHQSRVSTACVYYPPELEAAIKDVAAYVRAGGLAGRYDPRWLAVKMFERDLTQGDNHPDQLLTARVEQVRQQIHHILGEEVDTIIADSRYGFIHAVCQQTVDTTAMLRRSISDMLDRVVLSRFLGIPLFFLAMYLTFWVTINLGGCFIDLFHGVSGVFFVDLPRMLAQMAGLPVFVEMVLVDGVGGGVQTVLAFIPPIFFMFLCLSLLEDSGYMARAAFIMDRWMRFIGLPGKAFVPLLMGFGCNVPAILAARTLENPKDRILTVMMNPLMSCGARLPVYAMFAAAFFPSNGGVVIFALYGIGIVFAIMTGFLLKRSLLKGGTSEFIMELPPYHVPSLRGIAVHVWGRLKGFALRAGEAIIIVAVLLTLLSGIGRDGRIGAVSSSESLLGGIGKKMAPIFAPMGIREDNWPAAVGIFAGVFAKEAVIGTLKTVYAQADDDAGTVRERSSFSLVSARLTEVLTSFPGSFARLRHPFDFSAVKDAVPVDLAHGGATEIFVSARSRFDGRAGAFAYLLMVLLYMPCLATVAVMYQEIGMRWAVLSMVYLSLLAWSAATVFYQTARFAMHPTESLFWIGMVVLGALLFLVWLFQQKAWR